MPQGGDLTGEPTLVLIDVNAMFASCAAAEDPSLAGRPLVVAGNPDDRRSIVLTASYEARSFGIRTAMMLRQALALCPEAVVVPPDHDLYRAYHERLRQVLLSFTPVVEDISIDECYLDLAGCPGIDRGPLEMARTIREALRVGTGLVASLGVAPTRFLAKMAASLAKKEPDGVRLLHLDDVPGSLYGLPIGEFHGIGPKTEERLRSRGVRTIGDLAAMDEPALRLALGEAGPALAGELKGLGSARVASLPGRAKSISHELTFASDIVNREDLRPVILALSDQVAARLRREALVARTVTLRLKDASFREHSRSQTVREGMRFAADLYRTALGLLSRMPRNALPCRLAGVAATSLDEAEGEPQTLFSSGPRREEDLARTVDSIRERFGEGAVLPAGVLGSAGEDLYDKALFGSSFRTRGLGSARQGKGARHGE